MTGFLSFSAAIAVLALIACGVVLTPLLLVTGAACLVIWFLVGALGFALRLVGCFWRCRCSWPAPR
jgi:hypothetical protein